MQLPPEVIISISMSTVPESRSWLAYSVAFVAVVLALPLWREFSVPGQPWWNAFLAAFLLALIAATWLGAGYLQRNKVEIGEARFRAPASVDDARERPLEDA